MLPGVVGAANVSLGPLSTLNSKVTKAVDPPLRVNRVPSEIRAAVGYFQAQAWRRAIVRIVGRGQ